VAHAIAQGIGRKWAEEHLEERVNERTKELTLLIKENTRLTEQAQELAVLQERGRLARELHDSVSQTLYGMALGTRTARTLLHHDPDKLVALLDNIYSQAERGLTEMRTLIFELRPEELVTEGLVIAIKKQVAAVETRYGLQIVTELGKEPALSFIAKEALYRIAQEALHNIVKHAHVKSAKLRVSEGETIGGVILEVSDAGVGFNPEQSFPGHLGLQSMRERLARLGGVLEITSTLGYGVQIRATVPYKE
jgi:signal transduction histidine kinase